MNYKSEEDFKKRFNIDDGVKCCLYCHEEMANLASDAFQSCHPIIEEQDGSKSVYQVCCSIASHYEHIIIKGEKND